MNIKNENEEINDWRNEHGEPDFVYLQSLVVEDSVESLNKLRSIAKDLDVDYNSSNSSEQLIDMIRSATMINGDTGFTETA